MNEATLLEYMVDSHQHETQDDKMELDKKEGDKTTVADSAIPLKIDKILTNLCQCMASALEIRAKNQKKKNQEGNSSKEGKEKRSDDTKGGNVMLNKWTLL